MPARVRDRLTYANVISTLALFAALCGGAYAAVQLPPKSVGTKQLKNKAVKRSKIAGKAVTRPKIAPNAVTGAKVDESTLGRVPEAQHANLATDAATLGDQTPSYFEPAQRHEFGSGNHQAVVRQDLLEWTNAGIKVTTDGQASDAAAVIVRNTGPAGSGPMDVVDAAGAHHPVAQGGEVELTTATAELHFEVARPDGDTLWVRCVFPAASGFPVRCLGERSS
jgi:hypothetical protein